MKVLILLLSFAFVSLACDNPDDTIDLETKPALLIANVLKVNEVIGGYYSALPVQYEKKDKEYPAIIFIHGAGQYGNGSSDLSQILNEAIPALLQEELFPPSFTVQGITYSFIILAPQFSTYPSNEQVISFIDYAKESYRIDTSRVFLIGFSEGGRIACDVAASSPERFAALVAIAGVSKPADAALKCKNIATSNLPVWILHNDQDQLMDVSSSRSFVSLINGFHPAIAARYTEFLPYGLWNHDAWTKATDPSFKEEDMNIYEWMLQFKR